MIWFNRFAICLMMFSGAAEAKSFVNPIISFDLPDSWTCEQKTVESVCRPASPADQREALIIIVAKEAGPDDTLANYLTTLKQPRTLKGSNGIPSTSKVERFGEVKLGGQTWIQGLHLGSEVPGYYTQYLGTVKGKLAVLVTLSSRREVAGRFNQDFQKAMASLRITATQQLIGGNLAESELLPVGLPAPQQPSLSGQDGSGAAAAGDPWRFRLVYILGGALLFVIALALYLMRRTK